MTTLFQTENTDSTSKIDVAAIRLAIIFSDEKDIPSKYKKGTNKKLKTKEDSAIQIRFNKEIDNWRSTINNILEKMPSNLAWRFINVSPSIVKNINSVTENKEFIQFNDYLVLR